MTDAELLTDAELAAHLARQAGKILLEIRKSGQFEGKALGDAGDTQANDHLVQQIRKYRPDDGLLSEESRDSGERLGKDRVWIIDPVDGTREYSEGRDDWAVHVGLALKGKAEIGAVSLPGLGLVLRSDQPGDVPSRPEQPRMLVSRSRPAREAVEIAKMLDAELVPMGSAGAKAMAVVRGEAEIYLHSGGQYEWDNCAPVAVALAHGLHCSRINGSPLVYNNRDTYLPDLLICHRQDADKILQLVKDVIQRDA